MPWIASPPWDMSDTAGINPRSRMFRNGLLRLAVKAEQNGRNRVGNGVSHNKLLNKGAFAG